MAFSFTHAVASSVRAEMARQRWTQQRVADAVGMSQQALSARLRGVRPFDTSELERIAGALNVPVSSFLPTPERAA
ncbi:helix-turn-helix domain-containing protein [Micromonospora tulbaghiae]|nr:helix-turn-helix transcriptional regulator [Micromonospora tulbaghiae]